MLMTYSVKMLCLTAYLVQCAYAKTRTTFSKIPKTLNLAGLKCARDHYTTDRASMSLKENIPEILVVGLSIIMYVEPLAYINRKQLRIDFETRDGSEIGFHVSPRSDKDMTVFDSYYNRTWVKQLYGPYLFKRSSWRIYKLEFKISPISIRTYVDGQLLYEFNHRIPLSNYQMVNFSSSKAICSRIQFLYPN